MRSSRSWRAPVVSESRTPTLTAILIAVAVVLALVVVALAVTRGPGGVAASPGSADPGRLLNDALSAGSPIYVLVHSST